MDELRSACYASERRNASTSAISSLVHLAPLDGDGALVDDGVGVATGTGTGAGDAGCGVSLLGGALVGVAVGRSVDVGRGVCTGLCVIGSVVGYASGVTITSVGAGARVLTSFALELVGAGVDAGAIGYRAFQKPHQDDPNA